MIYGFHYNLSTLMGLKLPGVQIYRKFYTEEKERSNGVLAICVSKLPLQPYISLASMLFVSVFLSAFSETSKSVWIFTLLFV